MADLSPKPRHLSAWEENHPEDVVGTPEYRIKHTDPDGTYWGSDEVYFHSTDKQCKYLEVDDVECDLYGYHFHRDHEVYFNGTEYMELREIHAQARREEAEARSAERTTSWLQTNGGIPSPIPLGTVLHSGAAGREGEPIGFDYKSGTLLSGTGAPFESRDSEVPSVPAGGTFTGISGGGAQASISFPVNKADIAEYIKTIYGVPYPSTNFNFKAT